MIWVKERLSVIISFKNMRKLQATWETVWIENILLLEGRKVDQLKNLHYRKKLINIIGNCNSEHVQSGDNETISLILNIKHG